MFFRIISTCVCLIVFLSSELFGASSFNAAPPSTTVPLIFIHHSVGENWLSDDNGTLGLALMSNNYFTSDTNYGWGPQSIGDYTDIGYWWQWFRGPDSSAILDALYNEKGINSSYSRMENIPVQENRIIMFKSCFYNSALKGIINDPIPSIADNPLVGNGSDSDDHTISNAKGIYIDLLEYFKTRQDKLFVLMTSPPAGDSTYATNARALSEWLVNGWLNNYPYNNVAVFDFYNVLTTNGGNPDKNDIGAANGNHHRYLNGAIQHKTDSGSNVLAYPSEDEHPSQAGNLKATVEYLPLLNIFYHCWKGDGKCPERVVLPACTATATSSLSLNIPVVAVGGSFYIVNLNYQPVADGSVSFILTGATEIASFNCSNPATFDLSTGILHVTSVTYGGASYRIDLQYYQGANGSVAFKLISAAAN